MKKRRKTFAEGCTVFQLSTYKSHPLPQYQQWRYLDAYNFFKHHSPGGATGSDRRFAVVY